MLLNCYYYAPHNHSLLGRHLRSDLEHMRSLACDIVSVCVQEEQLTNWHQRRLRNVVDVAHEIGLKVHAVPNRWCGLLAGWLDGFSRWTLEHVHTWYSEFPGVSDPRHPAVRAHYEKHLRTLVDFGFDGLVWDEPRTNKPEVIVFLDEMAAHAKSLRSDLVVSLFAEAGRLDTVGQYVATRHIDFLGADGHIREDSHVMHRMKNTIFTTHAAFHPALTAAGKKTMFLLEAQRHRDEDLPAYLAAMDQAFSLPMDQLMFYYSAHEMSLANEEHFNTATWDMIRRIRVRSPLKS